MFRSEHSVLGTRSGPASDFLNEIAPVFQSEHWSILKPLSFQTNRFDFPAECSGWNVVTNVPTGTLDTFCTRIQPLHVYSSLHSKCESHYSANSSGSSTIYGTCHRCCQSEGRRGEDYDCHQPSRVLRGGRSEHTAYRLRSAIECHQRPGPGERSRACFDV